MRAGERDGLEDALERDERSRLTTEEAGELLGLHGAADKVLPDACSKGIHPHVTPI